MPEPIEIQLKKGALELCVLALLSRQDSYAYEIASRLSDARGVMLVLPNRDVWTFEALDDRVELEDSVFLAGNDGPRRTSQIVVRQDSHHAPSIRWSFVRSTSSPSSAAARRQARREPELPL